MELFTKDAGKYSKDTKWNMVKESSKFLDPMKTLELSSTKDPGVKTKWMVMAFISMPMEQFIEESGRTISSMEKGNMNSETELTTMENGKIIWWMVLDISLTGKEANGKGSSEKECTNQKNKNLLSKKNK